MCETSQTRAVCWGISGQLNPASLPAMPFWLPRFLRHVPPIAIREYLEHKRVNLPAAVDWQASPKELVATLPRVLDELEPRARDAVYRDLEDVDQLVGEVGQRALRSA